MRRLEGSGPLLVLVGTVVLVGVMGAFAAGAGDAGPRFTADLEEFYLPSDPIDASGVGCPSTGGPPTDTPPGVFVSTVQGSPTLLPGNPQVIDGMVDFEFGDPPYDESINVYAPVGAGGGWDLIVEGAEPAAGYRLQGLCITLLELTDDGTALEPASIEAALFDGATEFTIGAIAHDSTTTTTTTTTMPPVPQAPPAPETNADPSDLTG